MKKIMSLFFVLALVTSCATSTKKELDAERNAIGNVRSEADVLATAKEILAKSELSQDKKDQFVEIYKNHRQQLINISIKIKKQRILLLKTMSKKRFNNTKFNIAKKQLKRLVNKRFDIYIHQYKEAQKVIGLELENIFEEEFFRLHERM